MIEFSQVKTAISATADELRRNRDRFNDLDSEIGDSDHGDSIDFTFKKVSQAVGEFNDEQRDIGGLLKAIGRAITLDGGAAMGPLYGAALMAAGKSVSGKSALDSAAFVEMWKAFAAGIEARGGVKLGEKTMFDTIMPAVSALEAEFSSSGSIADACSAMVAAAEAGMNSTKDMLSQRGRSSRLGERSLGHIDPGSASMFVFVKSMVESISTS